MGDAKTAVKRLSKELRALHKAAESHPNLWAQPLENNILEWHFLIHGPTGSPYEGGVYHGQIIFGDQFPFKPPAIRMLTPSGRFVVGSDLCLSMSNCKCHLLCVAGVGTKLYVQ
uniref:UBC core domain-containing protein n=1 Tax=Palpitomonas bilix TaxID=652834 RepID=A0A7S3GLK6_9EUKA|mmetsp:Transcript_8739/g.23602  ORF Transcript_8739/g.23602 Transcript_8739/m.23602 type:complete len:114 (+) Transcript_8739:180-521(+)